MGYLLDTHVCLWAIAEDEKLSANVKGIFSDKKAEIFFSPISLWEIAIKFKIGKFPQFTSTLSDFIQELRLANFRLLPIKNEHLVHYFNFPFFQEAHKDPFDRLLLATANYEGLQFITKDEKFDGYAARLPVVW